jgi:hypothetical protein
LLAVGQNGTAPRRPRFVSAGRTDVPAAPSSAVCPIRSTTCPNRFSSVERERERGSTTGPTVKVLQPTTDVASGAHPHPAARRKKEAASRQVYTSLYNNVTNYRSVFLMREVP